MKLYAVVEKKDFGDEFFESLVTDVNEALSDARDLYNYRLTSNERKHTCVEIREYNIPFEVPFDIPCSYSKAYDLFEEYVEENYPEYDFANSGFACFSNGYNSIDWSSKE